MAVLSERILEAAGKRPEGALLARPSSFWRWVIALRWTRPPAPEVVIAQLNREGAQLVSSGAAAANALDQRRGGACAIAATTAPVFYILMLAMR
jgi:hypothetical protein